MSKAEKSIRKNYFSTSFPSLQKSNGCIERPRKTALYPPPSVRISWITQINDKQALSLSGTLRFTLIPLWKKSWENKQNTESYYSVSLEYLFLGGCSGTTTEEEEKKRDQDQQFFKRTKWHMRKEERGFNQVESGSPSSWLNAKGKERLKVDWGSEVLTHHSHFTFFWEPPSTHKHNPSTSVILWQLHWEQSARPLIPDSYPAQQHRLLSCLPVSSWSRGASCTPISSKLTWSSVSV